MYIEKYWRNYIGGTDDSLNLVAFLADQQQDEISLSEIFRKIGLDKQNWNFRQTAGYLEFTHSNGVEMDFHFAIDVITDLAAIMLECYVNGYVNLHDLDDCEIPNRHMRITATPEEHHALNRALSDFAQNPLNYDLRELVDDEDMLAMAKDCEEIRKDLYESGGRNKNFNVPKEEMKPLLSDWTGANGCLATNRIMVEGCKVGYCYREKPDDDWDSGWHFTAGDESQPYMDDPNQKIPVYTRVEVSGESLKDSQADFDQNNMPVVTTVFDAAGARKFARLTTEHVNERFAIVLDDMVLSAPTIREPIPGGRGQISGGFTLQGAKDLAVLLRSGALPAPLQVIEERTVGAGLGADTIAAGKIASVVGVIFIIIFMIVCYRGFGVIASLVLIVNLAMIIGITAVLGGVLTLPGIAGIVLTLGMAVDANILPFERIRDEIRAGSTSLRAVEAGFHRSMKAVLDGNLTNLICSLVLFQFGAGPIRGFAVTLSVGVLTTLFTCVSLSKVIIDWYMNGKNKKIGYVKSK